tara:strand:+ start:4467 stop:5834 length:1368 start_codon:yes stop_codon:yes gene_type:complete
VSKIPQTFHTSKVLNVIGAGLAGTEAAWQASNLGIEVNLYEMRPKKSTAAHQTSNLAELVCSNSFRSNSIKNAVGLLKEEMRKLDSLIINCAEESKIPAGTALAVDREKFSKKVTKEIENNPKINLIREEIKSLEPFKDKITIIATGPLTSDSLSEEIKKLTNEKYLYFYDAISPIVHGDSIDMSTAFFGSRYGKNSSNEEGDYINIGLSKVEYTNFIEELTKGEKIPLRDFEKAIFFEGCLPIEVMASRGVDTLAYGAMKPIGIENPKTKERFYAVIQLRKENLTGEFYSLVGFQTRLRYPEQKRIFSMLPALSKVKFLRFGSLHRNTYIHSPRLLNLSLQLKKKSNLFFAGQLTGVEGYIESCAIGLLAGLYAASNLKNEDPLIPPPTTAIGALNRYVAESQSEDFQPMNVNFGIFPSLESHIRKKEDRRNAMITRANNDLEKWREEISLCKI